MSPRSVPASLEGSLTVIGDIHGQRVALEEILARLAERPDFASRWIVFVGDFVDRGPDPNGTIQTILDLRKRHPRVSAVMGNHEMAFLGALGLFDCPEDNHWTFRYAGSYDCRTTCISYVPEWSRKKQGWPESLAQTWGDINLYREKREELFAWVRATMPAEHKEFLLGLPWCVDHPDYLIVHAGLLPNRPYSEQVAHLNQRDLTLDRPEWLFEKTLADAPLPESCLKTVVSGHVPVSKVSVFPHQRRVLIDTGAGYPHGGYLSAALLPEREVISVKVAG